jgi:hypothetical protein
MPRARKCRLDTEPELPGRIAALIRSGMYPDRAAVVAGVAASTHYEWVRRGRDELDALAAGNRPRKTFAVFRAYAELVDQALAEAEFAALAKITAGGPGWQAHAWILERRFRDRWSAKGSEQPTQPPRAESPRTPLDEMSRRREARRTGHSAQD